MSSALRLTIAGSSPATPRPGGASSCYLVRNAATAVLLDIGNGALGKLQLAIAYTQLDAVVVSHMHADHFFDLVPLRQGLKYDSPPRAQRIALWLPPGGTAALDALRQAVSPDASEDFFEATFAIREYDPAGRLSLNGLDLTFAPARHYIEGYAVRVGCDGAGLVYSSDTAPCDAVVELARGCDLFLCEASLGLGTESGERGHSSAREAGEMAGRAGVGRLAITHYSAAWDGDALVEAAKQAFSGPVQLVDDGAEFSVI